LPPDQRPRLIDCRELEEWDICRLPGSELVPLGTFPKKVAALVGNTDRGLVIYCHHGMRSLRATAFLREHGAAHTFSMAGGIEEWAASIDPEMARY